MDNDGQRSENLRRRAATASLIAAVVLVSIKLFAVIVTGSVAILSTLLDSAADVVAAFVTVIGVRQAAKPADHKHRFGHGKADALSALAHGVFIAAAGLLITA
ncbi:MAG: cation diffusion facilitator family transporter, partial [Geminicoccaceae bacterium]